MIGFSKTIQYRISLPRPSLEDLLNYKTYSDFPPLDKIGADLRLTRPVSQNLVPNSFFWLGVMQINFHISRSFYLKIITFVVIWTEFKRAAYLSKLGIGQNNLWKEISISTEKKNFFWQVGYIKWRIFLSSTLFFFTVDWTQTASFVTTSIPLSSLNGISCRFEFHNLWRAWNRQHRLFIIWHFSLYTLMMEIQFWEWVSL